MVHEGERLLTAPPAPTWRGYGAGDLERNYIEWVGARQLYIAQALPRKLRKKLEHEEHQIGHWRSQLSELREEKAKKEALIAQIVRVINGDPTDEQIIQAYERMIALDWVLGTRVDMQGRLFVQIRVAEARGGVTYDVGDFEIGFAMRYRYASPDSYVVNYIRVPQGVDAQDIPEWEARERQDGGAWVGGVQMPGYHLRTTEFVELVTLIRDRLAALVDRTRRYGQRLTPVLDNPEQVWDGYVEDPTKPYRRSISLLSGTPIRAAMRELEDSLRNTERRIRTVIEDIRRCQLTIRGLRADLAKVNQETTQEVTLDEPQLRKDIEYIARLPGVMGIKFDDNGVPVIHVRTTYVKQGRRYDMGDVEIHLTTEGRNYAHACPVKIRTTRVRHSNSLYMHQGGTESCWFCFGGRAHELEAMFDGGDYPSFVHLAINTLNAINPGSDTPDILNEYFTEIPLDAVWRKKRRRVRLRRKPKGSLEERLTKNDPPQQQ